MFLDLVKAFDRVPRELLWGVLRKFGANEKLVRLLISLHKHLEVQFKVSGITNSVESTIGVTRGRFRSNPFYILLGSSHGNMES